MIKYFCDRCGEETGDTQLCEDCLQEDLTCGFKVGDIVIASDGRVGVIEEICDCKSCKERGFYEPNVKMEIGVCQIWITNIDKEHNFYSFYQIGDHVYGNIDEESVLYDIECQKEEIKTKQKKRTY